MTKETPEAVRCALIALITVVDEQQLNAAVGLLEEVASRGGPGAIAYTTLSRSSRR